MLSRLAFRRTLPGPRLSALLCAAGFSLLLTLPGPPLSHVGQDQLRPFRWGLPALAVVTAAVSISGAVAKRIPRWIILLGDASYSTYLLHPFLLHANHKVAIKLGGEGTGARLLMVGLELSSSLLGGLLVHSVVEKPLMRKLSGTLPKIPSVVEDTLRRCRS